MFIRRSKEAGERRIFCKKIRRSKANFAKIEITAAKPRNLPKSDLRFSGKRNGSLQARPFFQKKKRQAQKACRFAGAAGRSRTGTVSLPADFESATSANSITAAYFKYLVILPQIFLLCNSKFQKLLKPHIRQPYKQGNGIAEAMPLPNYNRYQSLISLLILLIGNQYSYSNITTALTLPFDIYTKTLLGSKFSALP